MQASTLYKATFMNGLFVLFVWGFSSHLRIFHSYGEFPIASEGLQRISAFKTWLKNPKNRKLKLFLLFDLNVFFNVLSLIRINYQCSKLNTYLVTIFLSEWGYSVYIEIQLRLSLAPTFSALKIYERSDVTFSYAHL